MSKALMIQGTASSVGKSLITAGLCRLFKQDGYSCAPFKSQNMALNSYITSEGLEIGRAQAVQAEAAGIEAAVCMNPILLKPTGDTGSLVFVNGSLFAHMTAAEYFSKKQSLVPIIKTAYERLAAQYDIVVIEGAGSPAEINLKENDIVNMGMAALAESPVLLAGDIDRGGVFASIYGTLELLETQERQRIKGLIINKFRGDANLLRPGLKMLENLAQIPVVGLIPWLDIDVQDEDSLNIKNTGQGGKSNSILDIAVIRLPYITNFADFGPLAAKKTVSIRYISRPAELDTLPDFIIIPGTQNKRAALQWLNKCKLINAILQCKKDGALLMGISEGLEILQNFKNKNMHKSFILENQGEDIYRQYKEAQYDTLAAALRKSLNIKEIYRIIGLKG